MFAGVEFALIPAITCEGNRGRKAPKRPGAWLAGELILRCERQGLVSLPPELWLKTTVQQLILTGNDLAELPPHVHRLQQLRVLRLGHNHLQQLPEELCALQHLQHLDVQHNELDLVPRGLCRLVLLQVVNLAGNPLGGRFEPQGPSLQQLWVAPDPAPPRHAEGAGGSGSRHATSGTTGQGAAAHGDASSSSSSSGGGGGGQDPQHALVGPGGGGASGLTAAYKEATGKLLDYLTNLQAPEDAAAIKQAKLQLLRQEAAAQVALISRRADAAALEACLAMAQQVGLPDSQVQAVRAAHGAVATLSTALQQEDLGALGAALSAFEALCKPGRPDGQVYLEAHAKWRQLTRVALAKGWRCAPPHAAGASAAGGSSARGLPPPGAADGAEGGGLVGTGEGSGGLARAYLTVQDQRRKELRDGGALTHQQWADGKRRATSQQREQLTASLAQEQRQRQQRRQGVADKALEHCAKERAWPSAVAEAYPRGTFSLGKQQLQDVRELYASPKAGARAARA